jgi:hypothetical protein
MNIGTAIKYARLVASDQPGSESHEIAGDMGDEQAAQP